MWKELKINGKKFFMLCKFKDQTVECLLYNESNSWCEKETSETILLRAQECNKRIKFDEVTVKTSLQNEEPITATLLEGKENTEKWILTLKYKVQLLPFHFKWHLTKQTQKHFHSCIFGSLFEAINGLYEQNLELRDAVRKKDIEICQYKFEGAILRRATVATQKFDFTKFNEKYKETYALVKTAIHLKKSFESNNNTETLSEPILTPELNVNIEPKIEDKIQPTVELLVTPIKPNTLNESNQFSTEITPLKYIKRKVAVEYESDDSDEEKI